MFKHTCTTENADKFLLWIRTRGGIAVWRSVNLSNPGAKWCTPALDEEGKPYEKPTWEADSKPEKIITDPNRVQVSLDKEVKRFHVAVRRGQGFSFNLTNASSRKVILAVEKAGEGAYYSFDYGTQEAVIMAPEKTCSLAEYAAEKEKSSK